MFCSWEPGAGAHAIDAPGTPAPNAYTVEACQSACIAAADFACTAISFSSSDGHCFRYQGIVLELCNEDDDGGFDLYVRSDPHVPPPPSPPPHPPRALLFPNRTNASATVLRGSAADLNARYRAGRNDASVGSDLFNVGLLIHQFDFMDDDDPNGRPWIPGLGWWHPDGRDSELVPTWPSGDRISATIINQQMTRDPIHRINAPNAADDAVNSGMPVFSDGLAGIVLSAEHNTLLCSHAYDADSLARKCYPRGVTDTCIPGCTFGISPSSDAAWCTKLIGSDEQFPCAWRPTETGKMLRAREAIRKSGRQPHHKRFDDGRFYVEAIFDAEEFVRNLPRSIESVFFTKPSPAQRFSCDDALSGSKCLDYARVALRRIRRHFGLSEVELPFVRFDPFNAERPFTDVPSGRVRG